MRPHWFVWVMRKQFIISLSSGTAESIIDLRSLLLPLSARRRRILARSPGVAAASVVLWLVQGVCVWVSEWTRKLAFGIESYEMAGIQEGPEFGIGDFVLLKTVDIKSFMKNLKLRWAAIRNLERADKLKWSRNQTVRVTVSHLQVSCHCLTPAGTAAA